MKCIRQRHMGPLEVATALLSGNKCMKTMLQACRKQVTRECSTTEAEKLSKRRSEIAISIAMIIINICTPIKDKLLIKIGTMLLGNWASGQI